MSPSAPARRRPTDGQAARSARRLALDVLVRIDARGAYANAVLPAALASAGLDKRDRAFATELVYGVTRRRRALDWVLDPFLVTPPPPPARAALRLGAYQLTELGTPAHAAVSATVEAAPRKFRGLVNAVLRRVADAGPPDWPDEPTRLSYPDWIVERLAEDLGVHAATQVLEAMNGPGRVHRRADGYVQDVSSQLAVEAVEAAEGDLVAALCAAPGGKATALAARGAVVVAVDSHLGRIGRLQQNRAVLGATSMHPVAADGLAPPLRPGRFDAVLVDAPCSGLGTLRRRPDARWRIEPPAVARLAALQLGLLEAASHLLRPGGQLVYSVCTLTTAETVGVSAQVSSRNDLELQAPPDGPWLTHGDGGIVLPDADRDGMALFRWRRR